MNRERTVVGALTLVAALWGPVNVHCAKADACASAKFIGAGAESGAKPVAVAKDVVNEKDVAKVEWRVTGLGVFVPSVNGRRAESAPHEILMPGFTFFRKRRQETVLDVTELWNRKAGESNRLLAIVTPGWWCDAIAGKNGGKWPAFRGILTIVHEDGTVKTVATDESWQVATETPVVRTGIYEGEIYDATVPVSGWRAAKPSDEFRGEVSPRIGPPVVMRHDKMLCCGHRDGVPVPFCAKLKPGETNIIDFGQNCAAVPVLEVRAERGTRVTLRFAEMLNDGAHGHHGDGPEGTLYLANMRSVPSKLEYVCKGSKDEDGAMERYIPFGTFYGYRYASITADGPILYAIASVPVSSVSKEMERGTIETGNESVNRIVRNAYWGMLSNYLSVPTDCPQRDERLGWTGDTQVFAKTGAYFADTSLFMRKWMQDVRDTQYGNGVVPTVAPPGPFGGGGPVAGWSDAVVIVPWTVWKYLGDRTIVDENWSAMEKYLAYVDSTDYRIESGGVLADWLSFERLSMNQRTAWNRSRITEDHLSYQRFLNACHLFQDANMMVEMAADEKGREKYRAIAGRTKARILSSWFKPDGTLIDTFAGMQTPLLFALKLRLGDRAALSKSLVDLVRKNGNRLSTGFLGTPLVCEVLSEIGESELAYSVLLNREFPSWLYSIDQGATTMWERWDGYTKAGGFGDVGMNSFNHYAYGAVVAWLFEHAAGIRPGKGGLPGEVILAPEPDRRLGRMKARVDTKLGPIVSEWEYGEDGRLKWTYSVPDGMKATIVEPKDAYAND